MFRGVLKAETLFLDLNYGVNERYSLLTGRWRWINRISVNDYAVRPGNNEKGLLMYKHVRA
jgi:hypothetical protein